MKAFSNIAFISYKHEDEKWAVWLQRSLEAYRLPNVIRSDRPDLPKHLRPIFRDNTDLSAGVLNDELHKELMRSKFLIVICSPNTTKSDWINKEVQTFIDSGRSKLIIPFIVGGIPYSGDPATECLPKVLHDLSPEEELLGLDVHKIGRRQALVKVIAHILDVRFDVLWRRHQRQQRIRRAITGSILLLMVLSALLVYDYKRISVRYFKDYIDCHGVPTGLFPVDDISHRSGTFRFEYRRTPIGEKDFYKWRLSEVKYVNSAGVVRDFSDDEYVDLFPSMELGYTEGILTEIVNKDKYGIPVVRHKITNGYDGGQACIADLESAERQEGSEYMDLLNGRMKVTDPSTNARTKIKRYVYSRDSLGRITKVTYHSNNSEELNESAISNADGIFGKRYELDSLGRKVREVYINHDGFMTSNRFGVAQRKYYYNEDGLIWREEFLDTDGNLTYNERKYAAAECQYDKYGNTIEGRFLGTDGRPCYNEEQIAMLTQVLDNRGFCIEECAYDIDGKPCNCYLGWHKLCYEYDDRGNQTKGSVFDTSGKQCIELASLTATTEHKFDNQNRLIETSFFDTSGNPCASKYGYSRVVMEYDSHGNLVMIEHFGPDGKRCFSSDNGMSKCRITYNNRHQVTGLYYYDTEDNLCFGKNLFAQHVMKYDARGNLTEAANYDTDGQLTFTNTIGAVFERGFDEYGNVIFEKTLDKERRPAFVGGKCQTKFKYNKQGLQAEYSYLGDNDSLCINSECWFAICKIEYDEWGNIIKESFFDADSMPCYCKNGLYSMAKHEYDADNNLTRTSYYDAAGNPMLSEWACSSITFQYDNKRKKTEARYFDTAGQPCYNKYGAHWLKYGYDERGNETSIAYFDELGRPYALKGFEHKVTKSYDEFSRLVSISNFSIDGRKVSGSEKYCTARYKYSPNGTLCTEIAYYDHNDRLMSPDQTKACRTTIIYNERGKPIKYAYYDEDDKLTCRFGCAISEHEYNTKDQLVKTVSYDEHHRLIGGNYDKPIEKYEYNERNELVAMSLFNKEDDLFITIKKKYEKGLSTEYSYLDGEGKPKVMMLKAIDVDHPFAIKRLSYDDFGNVTLTTYLDEEGLLFDSDVGFATLRRDVSFGTGHTRVSTLFNSKNEPALHKVQHTHKYVMKYNEFGLLVEQSYYDENDRPALTPWGWARSFWDYNNRGELVETSRHTWKDNSWQIKTTRYRQATDAMQETTSEAVAENKQTTMMLNVENFGQMYQEGFRNSYHILEWNDWNMYQGIDRFAETLMKSKNTAKRLLLVSFDTGKVIEHTFSTDALNARVMDLSDKTGENFRKLAEIYEGWKNKSSCD